MMAGAGMIAAGSLHANGNVEVEQLGVNNTLVRVTGSGYLMLPVQELNEDARINVLVDGKIAETIYVRLAQTKTDYVVPFDLSPYEGKNVILDVVTPQGRKSVRDAKVDVCWKGLELTDTLDLTDRETKYRPVYHHTPPYGWMNDPNGMFYKDGVWHLYYQYNPYGSKWQNMTWGHSSSEDLIHWKHEPIAIRPDGLGSIFSGSCVVDGNNTAGYGEDAVIALYTSAGVSQMQSLAHSNDDGMTFEKLPSNPILTLETEARDPNMFWNEETGEWNLVLAHALDKEMLFFTSPDLKTWTLQSGFGKGEGCQDGVWECPDLFRLPVGDTGVYKWVLLCNINPGGPFGGSATQYFIGDWDGKTFTADRDASGVIPTKWLDYGKDYYATVTWSGAPDNRRTSIGWMSNWQYAADVPTTQYRSANSLPREIFLFEGADGELYAGSAPSPELLALRSRPVVDKSNVRLGVKPQSYKLPAVNPDVCEIEFTLEAADANEVNITLTNKKGENVRMTYKPQDSTFSFDRTESGLIDFSDEFAGVTVSPTFEKEGTVSVRLYIDRSGIELFGNDGQFTQTNLVFPTEAYTTIQFASTGGNAKLKEIKIYPLSI